MPVRNDFSHTEQNRSKIKGDIGRHILNGLNFNIKRRETSNATHLTIFWGRHWKKIPMIALETSLFHGCAHTHTHTHTCYTYTEICNHVLGGNKLFKRFKLQQKVRKNPKGTHRSRHLLKETTKKAQYASFKFKTTNRPIVHMCTIFTWISIVNKL